MLRNEDDYIIPICQHTDTFVVHDMGIWENDLRSGCVYHIFLLG